MAAFQRQGHDQMAQYPLSVLQGYTPHHGTSGSGPYHAAYLIYSTNCDGSQILRTFDEKLVCWVIVLYHVDMYNFKRRFNIF